MSFITAAGRKAFEPVLAWLENGAPHVDLDGRAIDVFDMSCGIENNSCGTACCIAGALVQFNSTNARIGELDDNWYFILQDALRISGIEFEKTALQLFAVDNEQGISFKEDDIREYATPAQAAIVLRHFLDTGEVNWDLVQIEVPEHVATQVDEEDF